MNTPDEKCVFCDIIKESGPNKIVYSDEQFVAFEDINPAAKTHYLLIPRDHIVSVKQLGPSHIPMLHNMTRIAKQMINSTKLVLGFHVPPFNSIDHLHLHIIEKPFKNVFRALKYPDSRFCNWFVPLDKLVAALERGKDKYQDNFTWDWDI
ncbi:hypothetical protein HDV06_004452 [Boothiomyces sp. JEL0866]|nr:hypothetical protein HDV06_004452 [Boothiomyces sp. JEL0866]